MDKPDPISLLVVDVSESWEEALKSQERGYFVNFDNFSPGGRYTRSKTDVNLVMSLIFYPHGTVRAGINAIIDTTRIAHLAGVPTYAAEYYTGDTDGEERTCCGLQPYIPKANRYEKRKFSAFTDDFATRLRADNCRHLMIIGYDRDYCVMETIKDALYNGITVVTSELCMLTQNRPGKRNQSLAFFKENTIYLKTLEEVWNYLRSSR